MTFLKEPGLFFGHSEMVPSIGILQSQFNISQLFAHMICSIGPIDRSLLGTTTLGQSGPESNGNERLLSIS